MQVILGMKNGRYKMTVINNNRKKRTNDYSKIKNFCASLEKPVSLDVTENLKLNYSNGDCFILRDYKKVLKKERTSNHNLYSMVTKNIDEEIKVNKKVFNINKKAFATLALTGSILLNVGFLVEPNLVEKTVEFVKDFSIEDVIEHFEKDDTIEISNEEFDIVVENETVSNEMIENAPISNEIISNIMSFTEDSKLTHKDLNMDLNYVEENDEFENIINERIIQTNAIYNGKVYNNPDFEICKNMNTNTMNRIVNLLKSEEGKYFIKYGEEYGVDPYLLVAIAMCETSLNHVGTLPDGEQYNGFAVGIMQHETPDVQRTITAFNYETNTLDSVEMSMEKAMDYETNVKMGAMLIQNYMQKYDNNIYLALQAYNYGMGCMDILISRYAHDTNQSFQDVISNYEDIGWMNYVKDMHSNPQKYVPNWEYRTYGSSRYIETVLSYYLGVMSENILSDGTVCHTNLLTMGKRYEEQNIKQF